jgi:hypothetical protein
MASAKDIQVKPISRAAADALVKRVHYSGSVVLNSQLHLGVYLDNRLEGVMQFGPPLDKRKVQGLVADTTWNGFIELNRMAFSDRLPRNSESRALSVAFRLMRKAYPHLRWVLSFADGAQCGDGTIYRASGFVLTGIKKNRTAWRNENGHVVSRVTMEKDKHQVQGRAGMAAYREAGYAPIEGFQLRYVYFLDRSAREQLTVPEIPFAEIETAGAGMYKGISRGKQAMTGSTGTAAGQHRPPRSNQPTPAADQPDVF